MIFIIIVIILILLYIIFFNNKKNNKNVEEFQKEDIINDNYEKEEIEEIKKESNINLKLLDGLLKESLTNSYKIFWFKAIYENILSGKKEMSFYEGGVKMISYASIPLIKYKLSLGKQDITYKVIEEISEIYPEFFFESNLENIEENILSKNNKDIKNSINKILKYVPYRLLSPYFKEEMIKLKLPDNKRNNYIEKRTLEDKRCFYKIEDKKIIVSEEYFKFILNNKENIKLIIDNNLIEYLQKNNPGILDIKNKIK